MKKFAAMFLAAALAACLLTGALAAPVTTSGAYGFEYVYGDVWVLQDSNIRSAPNLNASIITVVQSDTQLDFLGDVSYDDRGVAWYRVHYFWNDAVGWISSRYTQLDEYDY